MASANPTPFSLVDDLRSEIDALRRSLAQAGGPLAGLVGRSRAMQRLFAEVLAAAGGREPVLVCGESGSGRSAVAAALHRLSPQGREPARGIAFDGRKDAPSAADVAFAAAAGATLIVEGIAQAAPDLQAALAAASRSARLVVVGPRDPAAAVQEGKLSVEILDAALTIVVPPLRDRRDDIAPLAEHFLRPSELRAPAAALDPKALEAMVAHDWPGNVRELRNAIRRARALSDGPIIGLTAIQSVLGGTSARAEHAGEAGAEKELVPVRVGDSMAEIERRVLQRTLRFAHGNKKKAAEMLKLSLKTIYNKVKEYGMEREFNRRLRKEPRSD